MEKNAKIYIAGHLGMVGSAIMKNLQQKGYSNFVLRSIDELDLMDGQAVAAFFEAEKPEYVILAAAKVGGIVANNTYRAQFIYENLMIQNNIIHQSYLNGVKKLLFLGSTCIYPRDAPQPMSEDCLLTGPLEYTNEPYAIAKIAGLKMCESYNLQYGTNFIAVMPTNLYGPNDNFNLETSHVLPALLRKMHLGKCLMNGDWTALRSDFDKHPIEGVNGTASEQEILDKLSKYGIHQPETRNPEPGTRNVCRQADNERAEGATNLERAPGATNPERAEGAMNLERAPGATNLERAPGATNPERAEGAMNLERAPGATNPERAEGAMNPERGVAATNPESGTAEGVVVEIWGTGTPLREFLWSEEMADACVYIMERISFTDLAKRSNPEPETRNQKPETKNCHINIGSGKEISIRGLAEEIARTVGFEGTLFFNTEKPDGSMRKLTNPSKLHTLGWHHQIDLPEGLRKMYQHYLK